MKQAFMTSVIVDSEPARETRACTLVLTPHGRVRLESCDATESVLDPATARRIREAFDDGPGQGLFHLGAVEATSTLPPVLSFWRDFGRVFMTALCAVPDLDERRDLLLLPAPQDALAALAGAAPPMTGGEYLSTQVLDPLWVSLRMACAVELQAFDGTVHEFLHSKNPVWNLVGKVHFHLAQQKGNEAAPFAFLASYTTGLGRHNKVQHLPLGRALQQYAGTRDKAALLALLRPVHTARERSPLLAELVDSGSIFHPLGWTPAEAYRFLKDIPAFESSGIVVRVPDWWKSGRPSRPQVRIEIGSKPPGGLGLGALLDFSVDVALDGEQLSEREIREILASTDGLALIRGQWVEVDRARLKEVLKHWRAVEKQAGEGISFLEGMRLLSRAAVDGRDPQPREERLEAWSTWTAGAWLAELLEKLRRPKSRALGLGRELKTRLRPYQKVGVSWLNDLGQLGLGGCLADDMGLGKTIQVLALLLLRKLHGPSSTNLLVVPASLIGNWQAEIERFAPSLDTLIAHPSVAPSKQIQGLSADVASEHDVVITSYGFLARLPWAASFDWDLIALDEAQVIKNPSAKVTRAVKALRCRNRVVLTGTPVENRLSDLWSIFDFINPGLLGSASTFKTFSRRLESREQDRYAPLRNLIRPYILRRLKTDRNVISDLPAKTEVLAYCSLTRAQAALYQESVNALAKQLERLDGIQRRGVVLAFLTRFKQICNHPSQWLGDDAYRPQDSGKFARLRELCETLAARQEKVLVFTQYREMTAPLSSFLADVFGRPGLTLHGQVPVRKRRELVERFQEDERVPFFTLSLKAGGTGLNLTAASQVIHFDRWWNPAVENQATDRAFRIGQRKNVLVHKFVCRGTIEEKIETLIAGKQRMSAELLEGGADTLLTELDDARLLELVALDINSALQAV